MTRAYFVTGTDTDVGKTTISAGLLHRARQQGRSTAACKPLASGCANTAEGLRNSDALSLWAQCSLPLSYAQVNPVALAPAIAPHLAAQEVGLRLEVATLCASIDQVLALDADVTLVEGAGGWRVPLSPTQWLSELAVALQLPVILVVGVRLGCINHARLSYESIVQDGLPVAGWVANVIDPSTARLIDNLATLQQVLPVPCLGIVPHLLDPSAEAVSAYLELPA